MNFNKQELLSFAAEYSKSNNVNMLRAILAECLCDLTVEFMENLIKTASKTTLAFLNSLLEIITTIQPLEEEDMSDSYNDFWTWTEKHYLYCIINEEEHELQVQKRLFKSCVRKHIKAICFKLIKLFE